MDGNTKHLRLIRKSGAAVTGRVDSTNDGPLVSSQLAPSSSGQIASSRPLAVPAGIRLDRMWLAAPVNDDCATTPPAADPDGELEQ